MDAENKSSSNTQEAPKEELDQTMKTLFSGASALYLSQLETLMLCECGELERIVEEKPSPKTEAFQNLRILQVVDCKNLKCLFSISTAMQFQKLQELKVYGCENLTKIFDEDSSKVHQTIRFPKVGCIILKKLPKVEIFYSGKENFEWPELETVRVNDCPKLEKFVEGSQETPKLMVVEVNFAHKLWMGNLNKTIQELHKRNLSVYSDYLDESHNCSIYALQPRKDDNKASTAKQPLEHIEDAAST